MVDLEVQENRMYKNLTEFLNAIIEANMQASEEDTKDVDVCGFTKDTEDKKKEYVAPKIEVKQEEPKKYCGNNCCTRTLPGNITIVDNDHYILNDMVNGFPICNESHIMFNYTDETGCAHPGITESQLLAILYNRYKNNPKKLDLIRQLMN